jgi:TonB-dependent SusC/RagA subfamily outer membrane receptor
VKGEDISKNPTTNFLNNLSGQVAGLDIKQGTNFGGSVNVVLRGFKSLKGSNQALFVIDGVPVINSNVNSSDQANGRYGYDYGNAVSDLNPNDIADINVLKGAAATALYGWRAQNGAIIITTKKGKSKKGVGVEFGSSVTISTIDKSTFAEYQDQYGQGYLGQTFGSYLGSPRVSFGHDASYGPKYEGQEIWQYDAFIPGSPTFGQKTRWEVAKNGPATFFEKGTNFVNSVSFGGGDNQSNFRLSYSNTNATDILPNSSLIKNNFGGNATYKITDKLSGSIYANIITQKTKGRNTTGYGDNLMSNFRQWWGTNIDLNEQKNLYNLSNQNYTWNIRSVTNITPQYWDNPYFQRYQNFQNDSRDRFVGNFSLTYDVSKSINLMARIGTDSYNLFTEERRAVGSVPAAWSMRMDSLSAPPPAVTAWWARMLPQTCVPSAASPRPLKMRRSFWRCAARYICLTKPFSTCAPSRNCRVQHPLKTPATQQPVLCGRRTPASPAAGGFPSLCSMCSRSGARP